MVAPPTDDFGHPPLLVPATEINFYSFSSEPVMKRHTHIA